MLCCTWMDSASVPPELPVKLPMTQQVGVISRS